MLISHIHKFIYTKTLKTAGTTVEIYFQPACVPITSEPPMHETEALVSSHGIVGYRGPGRKGLAWFNHMPAASIRTQIGDDAWTRYFKFCVVRNPFDRAVSYWWMKRTTDERTHYASADFSGVRIDFSRWAAASAREILDRDKYLIDGNVCVDRFIRFEQLHDGIREVCQRVGLPYEADRVGNYKREFRPLATPYQEYFNAEARRAVELVYQWEIDEFGYSFES